MQMERRLLFRLGGALAASPLVGRPPASEWHPKDIAGLVPPLAFTMTEAASQRTVTEAEFRGRIALLYFGYTFCPDVCPTTLTNLGDVVDRLGTLSDQVRVLFVTVDPRRDTLPVLRRYVALFASQVVGLRGTDDQLMILARRYRVLYSVTPATSGQTSQVSHSAGVFGFDRVGAARLLEPSMATAKPDIEGLAADLQRLLAEPRDRIVRDRPPLRTQPAEYPTHV
jgi:protein SCO1/2